MIFVCVDGRIREATKEEVRQIGEYLKKQQERKLTNEYKRKQRAMYKKEREERKRGK